MKIKYGYEWLKTSTRPLIIMVAMSLMMLYGLTMAWYFASSPSEGFSREIVIDTVDYSYVRGVKSPVVTVVSDNGLYIVAIDGESTKVNKVTSEGKVDSQYSLELNMYKAYDMGAYESNTNELTIYYLDKNLHEVVLNMTTQEYIDHIIAEDVASFEYVGDQIVFEAEEGLYGYVDGVKNLVLEAEIESYASVMTESRSYILASTVNESTLDIVMVQLDDDMQVDHNIVVMEGVRDSYIQNIQEIFVKDGVLTGLYVFTDNKFGYNYLTIQQIDLVDGHMIKTYDNKFLIFKSKFVINDVKEDVVEVLMQQNVHRGVNLVKAQLAEIGNKVNDPLTKTRKLSRLSEYVEFEGEEVLIFWDDVDTTRVIQFATTKDEIVKATTSVCTISFGYLLSITLFVMILALFIGAIPYIFATALIPTLLVIGMTRTLSDFKNRVYIQNLIGALVETISRIMLTYYLIHTMGQYKVRPLFIGEEPWIYVVMIVMSVISYLISTRYIRQNKKYQTTMVNAFLLYIFTNYLQYTLVILIYIGTTNILNKL